MLALRIEYLTGRATATRYNDRTSAEWPPHPARVFSALVSTWADADPPDDAERRALEWLQRAGAPAIAATPASKRDVATHFVPVNDLSVVGRYDKAWEKLAAAREEVERAAATVQEAAAGGDGKALKKAQKEHAQAEKALARTAAALAKRASKAMAPDDKESVGPVKTAARMLPGARTRQPRTFPSVTPHDPVVHLLWDVAPDPGVRAALAGLAARLSRVGHSSSLVACRLCEEAPEPRWVPDDRGDTVLRVPDPDQLRRLGEAFERHREVEPRVLPCRHQRYTERRPGDAAGPPPARGVFSPTDWIVLRRMEGPLLPSVRAVEVASAVRAALMKYADDPPPPLLSGHTPAGPPVDVPHLAIVPLPFVAHEHADGAIRGVVLMFPREVDPDERTAVLRALGRWERAGDGDGETAHDDGPPVVPVNLGRAGVLHLERMVWEKPPHTLQPATWSHAATTWVSVTPVALDRHPGKMNARDPGTAEAAMREAEATVAQACVNIGLPHPADVELVPSVPVPGAAKARAFPRFPPGPGKLNRFRVHARVRFEAKVQGPILLGAGRYLGLGLMRPLPDRKGGDR